MVKFTRSIAFKFSAVSAATLAVIVLCLTVIGSLNVRYQAVTQFESSSHARIIQADESLDSMFKEVEQNVTYLSKSNELRAADQTLTTYFNGAGWMTPDKNGEAEQAIYRLLKNFGDSHPNMRYLDIGTKWGGYVQWPIESLNGARYDPRVRPWYKLAMTTPDNIVRPAPYTSAAGDGGAIIPFARVVKNTQGETIGVLEGDISLTNFARLTKGIKFGDSGYLMVTDASHKILINPKNPNEEFKSMQEIGGDYNKMAAVKQGLLSVYLGNEKYRVFVYTSQKNNWKYYALMPESEMMAAANALTRMLIAAGIIVLFLAVFILIFMGQRMVKPIRTLADLMHEISAGDGDMTRRLPATSKDEIGMLAVGFNTFVENQQRILLDVMTSSQHLKLAAAEVSAGNQDLSSRTELQASSIQQTAATMEQLSSTVRGTADRSRAVNSVAENAVEVAQRGNAAVSSAAKTMNTAVEQSGRIIGIVGMIESIAFQTNILALNAAVESARAGESGRGFAVVASEVRNLAQRSTNAAKEIKILLDSSVENVVAGAQQVNLAGKTISELTEAISDVATITHEISSSAQEQSQAIKEINQSVALMEQSTQQNATLVQEISAASESLSAQGRALHATVGFFKLH
ncbi:HAMP domain-containing protein [Rahnella sp. BCC 1045]|uniref:methyl-accepting chemotaxis protein n=1 Tax=Rahnella sp. BCC 1045 TaxID=2816251 RepID=UPI001C27310A|nr:methyl-accepting chemotaxis protein [Rahnella sp. BCC 1045]MBU9818352.1 HAMP domain-containing protein [Rahnella sp. BCC 1045]